MRLLLFLLLFSLNSFGQTTIPCSGTISTDLIKQVMYNLGQITLSEKNSATSISFLNSKSTLSDKTAPFSLSDWYCYGGGGSYYYVGSFPYATTAEYPVYACYEPISKGVYATTPTITVGSYLYTDYTLSTPQPNGSYRMGITLYIVTGGSGQVTSTEICDYS